MVLADWNPFHNAGIRVIVLREDLRHPLFGGNKCWKLKYNLDDYRHSGRKAILSFGGAWSNHLSALSEICAMEGIELHAVIRGEERPVNARILRMKDNGTHIHYISRAQYRLKDDETALKDFMTTQTDAPSIRDLFILPEGANNEAARKGCSELAKLVPENTDWLACAIGTGGTITGLADGITGRIRLLGIPVVRTGREPEKLLSERKVPEDRFHIEHGFEEGGYGKSSRRLNDFIQQFTETTGIPLEPVYTGKLFFAVNELAKRNFFKKGEHVVLLHSGGVF